MSININSQKEKKKQYAKLFFNLLALIIGLGTIFAAAIINNVESTQVILYIIAGMLNTLYLQNIVRQITD